MAHSVVPPLNATRRIGIIGDIHTELAVLKWAIATLRAHEVEHLLATGDIADGPNHEGSLNRCCDLLAREGVHAVLGNHDRWLLDGDMRHLPDATFPEDLSDKSRAYLRGLPASRDVNTPLGLLMLGHGLGGDDMATLYPHDHGAALTENAVLQAILQTQRYKLLVAGHTHRRMVRHVDGVTIINAGTLLRRKEPGCGLLDFEAREARFFDHTAEGATVEGPCFPL